MPGTSAGIRKAWKTRRAAEKASTALTVRPARTIKLTALQRIAAASEQAAKGSGYVSGLDISLMKIEDEGNPKLRALKDRVTLYDQMGNDAKIAAQERANILPLISAVRWKVEGGTQEMRDLIEQNLLRKGDSRYWCETSWTQRLLERMQCLRYGFALHGKTWDVVDGYRIFRRLTYLHPNSLGGPLGPWEWNDTGDRLVAIHRAYKLPNMQQITDERIPIEQVDATVWWQTGENWEGRSLFRSMYGAFIKKDLASKIGMIALMNGGVGIPMATGGPADGAAQAQTLQTIAKDLRGGSKERQYIYLANGQKIEFLTTNGTIIDARPMVDEQNMDIAAGGATDFMQTGQTQSGSRAGGSVMMIAYMQQLEATKIWLQEQINHGAGYLKGNVEELLYENFSTEEISAEGCPEIKGSCVSPTEQLDNLPLLGDLVQKGLIPRTLSITNAALDKLGMQPLSQEEFDAAVGPGSLIDAGMPSGQPKVPGNGGAGRPNEVGPSDVQDPRNDKAGRAFGLQDGPAQKKTPIGANLPSRSPASWRWLRSTPA